MAGLGVLSGAFLMWVVPRAMCTSRDAPIRKPCCGAESLVPPMWVARTGRLGKDSSRFPKSRSCRLC